MQALFFFSRRGCFQVVSRWRPARVLRVSVFGPSGPPLKWSVKVTPNYFSGGNLVICFWCTTASTQDYGWGMFSLSFIMWKPTRRFVTIRGWGLSQQTESREICGFAPFVSSHPWRKRTVFPVIYSVKRNIPDDVWRDAATVRGGGCCSALRAVD